ncbi:putative hemolysin [Arsenophonus nasoniae]|uniref:putative hemolysin n=1 Tax=Arsenophonus nasoniae TaxID=638 RepID=UPI003CC817E8
MKKMLLLITYVYVVGCTSQTESLPPTKTIGMANPASVYCIKKGGKLTLSRQLKAKSVIATSLTVLVSKSGHYIIKIINNLLFLI